MAITVANAKKMFICSDYPIDKIVYTSPTISIVNSGPTSPSELAKIVTSNIPNPVGKRIYLKFKWSLDNSNWQTGNSHMWFNFSRIIVGSGVIAGAGLRAAVSIGIDANYIYIRTANGYHGDIVYNPSGAFTPISQTFYIKYWLYEV